MGGVEGGGRAKEAGHNAYFAEYRAAGRLSAPRGETLLLFPPQPIEHFMVSARARTTAEGWDWRMGARYVVREHDTTQTVLTKEI